jgi:hypothetical protein
LGWVAALEFENKHQPVFRRIEQHVPAPRKKHQAEIANPIQVRVGQFPSRLGKMRAFQRRRHEHGPKNRPVSQPQKSSAA